MTQSEALTLPISRDKLTGASDAPLDLDAVHRWHFSRRRWFAGMSALAQATCLIVVGVFLFRQISETPKLALQMTIVSSLLVVGGALCSLRAVRDFCGYLQLAPHGFVYRTGFRGGHGDWSNVKSWHVNEIAKTPELPSVRIETEGDQHTIPGGMLDSSDLHKVRRLLCVFAEGKDRSAS
ncbi:MAG: hypothetical protein U0939_21245 [Pirellulales bacterium]